MSYANNDASISAHQKSSALRKNISNNVRKSLNNIDCHIYRRKPLNLNTLEAMEGPAIPSTAKAAKRTKILGSIQEFPNMTSRGNSFGSQNERNHQEIAKILPSLIHHERNVSGSF